MATSMRTLDKLKAKIKSTTMPLIFVCIFCIFGITSGISFITTWLCVLYFMKILQCRHEAQREYDELFKNFKPFRISILQGENDYWSSSPVYLESFDADIVKVKKEYLKEFPHANLAQTLQRVYSTLEIYRVFLEYFTLSIEFLEKKEKN